MKIDRRAFLGLGGAALAAGIVACSRQSEAQPAGAFPYRLTDAQWRRRLNPTQYAILRQGVTERAGTSPLDREHRRGTFLCAGCNNPLYSSAAKFDSGTGWPSFFRPLPHAIVTRTDRTLMMERNEVLCARCGGHLGHVFDDGPPPTGLRYCMNGGAMLFRPA